MMLVQILVCYTTEFNDELLTAWQIDNETQYSGIVTIHSTDQGLSQLTSAVTTTDWQDSIHTDSTHNTSLPTPVAQLSLSKATQLTHCYICYIYWMMFSIIWTSIVMSSYRNTKHHNKLILRRRNISQQIHAPHWQTFIGMLPWYATVCTICALTSEVSQSQCYLK